MFAALLQGTARQNGMPHVCLPCVFTAMLVAHPAAHANSNSSRDGCNRIVLLGGREVESAIVDTRFRGNALGIVAPPHSSPVQCQIDTGPGVLRLVSVRAHRDPMHNPPVTSAHLQDLSLSRVPKRLTRCWSCRLRVPLACRTY